MYMEESAVSLTCECGTRFERKQVSEKLKKKTFYKWKFRYCNNCFEERVRKALKRLPGIIKILAEVNERPE